jgi:hypothetical protein
LIRWCATVDEKVDVLLANLVRARGFEVVTTVEAIKRGKTDAEQIAFAVSQLRALLTHNRADFEQIAQQYLAAEATHFGLRTKCRTKAAASELCHFISLKNLRTPFETMGPPTIPKSAAGF